MSTPAWQDEMRAREAVEVDVSFLAVVKDDELLLVAPHQNNVNSDPFRFSDEGNDPYAEGGE